MDFESCEVEDPWYVRVTNGRFFASISGSVYKYYIAEFLSQTFNPEPPIKYAEEESAAILSNTLIKLDHDNIYEDDDESLYLSIEITDANGAGKAAYTTDTSLVGTIAGNGQPYVKWDRDDKVGIRSIDHRTGFLDIDGLDLNSNWEVTASYYYEEVHYEFTFMDFNPISNKEALTTRTSIFVDAETTLVSKTKTLYYLKTDQSGKVIESNWDDFDNDSQTYSPDGQELFYELKPSWMASGDHHLFVNEFSVEQSGTFLILADMTTAEAQDASEMVTIDTRVRGGGIAESRLDDALSLQDEVRWYWDQARWDGTPYPGNASYLVEIPLSVLDGAGGTFQADEVREVIERHTAFGVYPVARAYGIQVVVSGVEVTSSGVWLEWGGYGY